MKYSSVLFLLLCFILIVPNAAAQNTNFLDPNFAPVIEQSGTSVNVIVKQPDGKILVGGYFLMANNSERNDLARFNVDGSLDQSFVPSPFIFSAFGIRTIVVQPDGKILVGGNFLNLDGTAKNIVRLNPDGSTDATFNAVANVTVNAIALQPDGKVVIGGAFTTVNGTAASGTARLNANGSRDTSFGVSIRTVYSIALQPDGGFIFGGNFTTIGTNPTTCIVKTNATGVIDTAFSANASANSIVRVVKNQTDGKILIGGSFTVVDGISRTSLARINADGTLDASFAPVVGGSAPSVESIDFDANGKIVIGGAFVGINGSQRLYAAKLNGDGTLDNSFVPANAVNAVVHAVLAESGGSTLIGGEFQGFSGSNKYRIARLDGSGAIASTFNAGVNTGGEVHAIEVQPDGKIIAAGNFFYANGRDYGAIARLLPDGAPDTTFASYTQSRVIADVINDVKVLPNGKIVLVGTLYINANFNSRFAVLRLNSDGTLDNTFTPVATTGSGPLVVKPLANGQLVVAGSFTQLNGIARNRIAKINSDGSLDTAFSPTFSATAIPVVQDAVVRNDGKILIGGYFSTVNGTAKSNLALLNQDGTLDASFTANTDADGAVYSIYKFADDTFAVGGSFISINGTARKNVAKLTASGQVDTTFNVDGNFAFPFIKINALPDGKIILAGQGYYSFEGIPNRFVVLNPNGSLNAALPDSRGFNGGIFDVEVQSDGKFLVGGSFSKVGTAVRYGLARLNSTNFSAKTFYDFDGDGKADVSVFRPDNGTWYLLQSSAGFTGLAFGVSTDKLAPADYDGDGKTDVAVVRNGVWYLQRSSAGFTGIAFGDGNDIPVPADYDGDGKADLAVFRPSNGTWYLLQSTAGFSGIAFGLGTDKPVPADYDGDGKADIAVNRNGNWYLQRSQLGFTGILFGDGNDKTVPADYDGDGKADIAVFRPSNGTWYLLQSTAGFTGIAFGLGTDIPVAADYDGDGKADIAVVRNGNWYLNRTTQGFTGIPFGTATDKPIPNAFVR